MQDLERILADDSKEARQMRDKFLESNEGLLDQLKIPNGEVSEATTILPERLDAEIWRADLNQLWEEIDENPEAGGKGKERLKDMLLEYIRESGKKGVKDGLSAWQAITAISSLRASSLWGDLTADEQSEIDSFLLSIKNKLLERIRENGEKGVGNGWNARYTIIALSALSDEVSFRLSRAEQAEANRDAHKARNPDTTKNLPPEIPMVNL